MAKTVRTKVGDIFSVKLDDGKKYFQYITNDFTQLNSDVIRVFKTKYPINTEPDLFKIVADEVEFYAHVVIKWGFKLDLWEKVGNIPFAREIEALFKDTNDYGSKVDEEPIKISDKWYVWRVNEEFKRVGKLEGENRKAEIGVVISPHQIVKRMATGSYTFVYPGFE
ncbi:MAG: hypothetical protein P4L16_07515 [Chlamydiales bacterium]|nr:hypothetical protein [Chlamydiales bacterium]